MRPRHEPLDETEIAVMRHRFTELFYRRIHVRVLEQRQQARAQLRNPHRLDMGECAEHRHPCQRPDGVLDDAAPVVVGHVVEDHADDAVRVVELLDAERGGGSRFAGGPSVDDQHDRGGDDLCDLEGAAGEAGVGVGGRVGGHAVAVEQAHRTFNDDPIGTEGPMGEGPADAVGAKQPGVEVAARPATCMREIGGVDEIGPHLEGLDGASSSAQCGSETQADRGFPGT